MNIFDKRPLFLMLCVGIGGFVLSSLIHVYVAIASIVLLILSIVFRFFYKTNLLIVISVFLILCIAYSAAYFGTWFHVYERFEEEVEIHGTVVSHSQSDYNDRFYIRTSSIAGEPFTRYNLVLDIPRDDPGALRPGCTVHIKSTLSGFSSSDGFDAESYYFSRGISGTIDSYENMRILDYDSPTLAQRFSEMRESLVNYAILYSNRDAGTLLTALLIGERDSLSDSLRLDFTRLGITHILALSGMHLSIIAAAVNALLTLLRIGRKPRTVITVIFILLYLAFTGFSVSVVRAGVMLILYSLLYLLTRGSDSVTALAVAVTVICFATPYAIYDTALWLSAFATLGVVILSEYARQIPKGKRFILKPLRLLLLSALASVFAITMTLPITIEKFYGVSVASVFATIIFSVLAEIIMYLGTVVLIFGGLFPFLGKILIFFTQITVNTAAFLSDLKFIYASGQHTFLKVGCILLFVLMVLFIVLKLNKKARNIAVIVICSAFTVFMCSVTCFAMSDRNEDTALYFSAEKSDCFLLRSEGECALINSSTYSKSLAYSISSVLEENDVTVIDKYIFTHYAYAIPDDTGVILKEFLVEEIYLPKPRNDSEERILSQIQHAVSSFRTEIVLYELYAPVKLGKMSMRLIFSRPYGEGTSTNAFFLELDGTNCSYMSSGILDLDDEIRASVDNFMEVSEIHIYGKHGKKYKNKLFIETKKYQLDMMILNSIYLTPESLEAYENSGCKIYSHPLSMKLR